MRFCTPAAVLFQIPIYLESIHIRAAPRQKASEGGSLPGLPTERPIGSAADSVSAAITGSSRDWCSGLGTSTVGSYRESEV